jgi:hypothetical protein
VCTPRPRQERLTNESASLSWLTPTIEDGKKIGTGETTHMGRWLAGQPVKDTYKRLRSLAGAVTATWPTPMATMNRTSDKAKFRRPTAGSSRGGPSFGLEDRALTWPTPTCNSSTYQQSHGKDYITLPGAVRLWPTPRAEERNQYNSRDGDNYQALSLKVLNWATPTSRDWKDGACADSAVATNGLLGRQALRTQLAGQSISEPSRVLNPRFAEALMAWPINHTRLCECMNQDCLHDRTDRLRAIGNGVVPDQAALALQHLGGL